MIRLKRDYGEVDQLQVSKKGPADFVTAADIRTEKLLREELLRARPSFGFLMEEAGEQLGADTHRRWIIDPIDGTTNFVHGIAQFAISIAAEENGEITAGLIFDPISEELFWAEKGRGAYLNDRRIQVSSRAKISQSFSRRAFHSWAEALRKNDKFCRDESRHVGLSRPRRFGSALILPRNAGRLTVWESELQP